MTKSTKSVSREVARADANAKLVGEGWVFVPELAEYRHSDGRRGRLAMTPDFEASTDRKNPELIKRVELQFPSRKPTMHELMNRIPTAPPMMLVVEY